MTLYDLVCCLCNFQQDGTLGLLLHGTSVVGFCSEEVADQGWPQPQLRPCSKRRVCLFRLISHKFMMYLYPFFTHSNLSENCSPIPLVVLQPFPSNTSWDSLCQIHLSRWHDCLCAVQVQDGIFVSRCITRFKCSALCVFFFCAAPIDFVIQEFLKDPNQHKQPVQVSSRPCPSCLSGWSEIRSWRSTENVSLPLTNSWSAS